MQLKYVVFKPLPQHMPPDERNICRQVAYKITEGTEKDCIQYRFSKKHLFSLRIEPWYLVEHEYVWLNHQYDHDEDET